MYVLNKSSSLFAGYKCFRVCFYLMIVIGLMGCEAKLRLDGVNDEHRKLIVRFDEFQAAAVSLDSALNVAVLVGSAGVLLSSQNDGEDWRRITLSHTGRDAALIDVTACPDGSFAALDFNRYVWISDASASKWESHAISTEEDVLAIACDDTNRIWVVGAFSSIFMSNDRGQNWDSGRSLGDDYILTDIQFLRGGKGFIAAEFGKLLFTDNDGLSWQEINSLPEEFYPLTMHFASAELGWVGGLEGTILHTGDGGRTWRRENSSTNTPIYGINGEKGNIYAVGNNGILLKHELGQWRKILLPEATLSYLRAICFLAGGSKLLVAGGSGAMQVIDLENID